MSNHPPETILEKNALVPEKFSPQERAELERHFSECASCKEQWEGFARLYKSVADDFKSEPSEQDQALAERLLRKRRGPHAMLDLPESSQPALDTFKGSVAPYIQRLPRRVLRYIYTHPYKTAGGFSLAAALLLLVLRIPNPKSTSNLDDTPVITNVTFSGEVGPLLHMTIEGSGFGSPSAAVPCSGTMQNFTFNDYTTGYEAGHTGDDIIFFFDNWTTSEINTVQFAGSYGLGEWKSYPGDSVGVQVQNLNSKLATRWTGRLPDMQRPVDSGMDFTGSNSANEASTVQSQRPFKPPFTAEALVASKISSDEPFILAIASADGTEGISIDGVMYDGNPNAGIRDRFASGTEKAWTGFEDLLVTGVSVDVQYKLSITVDEKGFATLRSSKANNTEKDSVTRPVGLGPFYVLLLQHEGVPYHSYFRDQVTRDSSHYIIGPNEATWQWVSLTKGDYNTLKLVDDFTQDDSLNTDIWKINGPVGTIVGKELGSPPSKIVAPVIKFLKKRAGARRDSSIAGVMRK